MDTPAPQERAAGSYSPALVAVAAACLSITLAVAGVYVLAGTGWAMIAAAAPFALIAVIIFRGLTRGG